MLNKLKEIGLTKNESLIYKALLEKGPCQVGKISQRTGLHRRTIYDTIEILIQKGLISYIKQNKTKIYEASSPEKFLNIIKQKENIINEIMPSMMNLYNQPHEKSETNFYKGKSGIKTILEDQIQQKEEIYILGASESAYNTLQYYFKWYDKRRKENNIKTKIIFNKTDKKIKIPFSQIRYLPKKYSSNLAINIYGNTVAIILWQKENPIAIIIKEKEIAESYKKHFELIWKIAKP